MFPIWKGNRARLRVDLSPQHLFFVGPAALACHQLLDPDGILGFARQGHKSPFQCPDCAAKDFVLLVCPPLHRCYHIIHVTIDV